MAETESAAPARAALAGNPSDNYGGAVLAIAVPALAARVRAAPAPELRVAPPSELVRAAVRRFARDYAPAAARSAVTWTTSIPREVGLGGSSAIVIATLRALCQLYRPDELPREDLANCALAVETEELGIAAGLQDRVAQAYGGLTFMDFGRERRYEPLDPRLLPPLALAWRAGASGGSGVVHTDLRDRFESGEHAVIEGMRRLRGVAHEARAALQHGDHAAFTRCLDVSFDARRSMMSLDPRHVEMVELARRFGAGANYTGSGGAVVLACRDERQRAEALAALRSTATSVLAIEIGSPPI